MNDPPVLYQRAKASDMLQSIVDTSRLLRFELDKFREFYPGEWNAVYYSGGLQNFHLIISQFRSGMTYHNLDQSIQMLREKGL